MEREEAYCDNLHRAQSVALARPVDVHDAKFGGMVAAQRQRRGHKVALPRIRGLGKLYRQPTGGGKEGGSLMSIVVGADGIEVRMVMAEKRRIVGVEADVLAVVVESMRLGALGKRVTESEGWERISRLAGARYIQSVALEYG